MEKTKKKFITSDGKIIQYGAIVNYDKITNMPYGSMRSQYTVTLNSESEDFLKSLGAIKDYVEPKKATAKFPKIPTAVPFYINRIAERLKKDPMNVAKWLDDLNQVYPVAVFDILTLEISDFILSKKKEYGMNCNFGATCWVFDSYSGHLFNVPTQDVNPIQTGRFQNKHNALMAKEILKKQLELMYGKLEG